MMTFELNSEDIPNPNSILTEFLHQVHLHPNKVAVKDEVQTLSYSELHKRSNLLSQELALKYLVHDSNPIVAILLPNGPDFILSVLAVFQASKAYAPLSADYPSVKLKLMLQQLGTPLLITKAAILASTGLIYENVVLLDRFEENSNGEIYSNEQNPVRENTSSTGEICNSGSSFPHTENSSNIACVYFTSGSTGVPKAVQIEHSAFLHCYRRMAEYLKVSPSDEILCLLNPGFVLSTHEIWPALISGATVHIPPSHLRYDMSLLRAWVKAQGTVSIIVMVASSGEAFFRAQPTEFPSSLRALILAGEKLQTLPPAEIPFTVYAAYGSTEAMAISITGIEATSPLLDPVKHTLVGKCFPGVQVHILEEGSLDSVPHGETGEIVVGGHSIGKEYLNADLESNQKFVRLENGTKVFRTGDLGYFLPSGDLVVLNRKDNLIKVSGYRFDLAELESALLQNNSVEKVVAVLENGTELRFHLFYKLSSGARSEDVTDSSIFEFLQQRLPHYAFPHSITQVEEFPRNFHGKVDKAALLLIAKQKLLQKIVEAPMTETELVLISTWANVLQIPINEISRTDNFFSLGGTSSHAVKVISLLKERNTEFKVEPFNIFRIPILKDLAQFLELKYPDTAVPYTDFDAEVLTFSTDLEELAELPSYDFRLSTKAILVTGATGYLGSSLVSELLNETYADIYCIIRSGSEGEARERFMSFCQGFEIKIEQNYLQQLHFIAGNLSLSFFGLSKPEYNTLASKIDQVYHCAAEVHWLKRYEELCLPNVQGTREVIRFAATNKVKFLHYISTVGVLGTCATSESKITADSVDTEMGYTQSKWVAEKLVWKAFEAGIPGTVYRPGIIGSHAELGIVNSNDFITLLFRACKEIGAYPNHAWEFPYGSLDFTSKCIVALYRNFENNDCKAFHTFQNVLSFADFFDYFDSISVERVSVSEWQTRLLNSNDSGKPNAAKLCKLFISTPHSESLTFFELIFTESKINATNTQTIEGLAGNANFAFSTKLQQITNFASSVFKY